MKLLRTQIFWWLATLITHGSTLTPITLLEVLQSYPELSTLHSHVNASSNATSLLSSANNNFTFLAPSNDAIDSFISQNPQALTEDLLDAILQYSLLRGGFPALSFSDTSRFVSSNLANASYANVTGGQAVELVLSASGTPQVVTGNKNISTSTFTDIVCSGGIVHIMNEVLAVPLPAVSEITAAHLEFFISILNLGGYLSPANEGYVNEVQETQDVTYFIPNSAEALAEATKLDGNSSSTELQAMFQYHVVPNFVGYSPLLKNGMVLKTEQGSDVTITTQDGDTYVNAAKIIAFDYIVANGVIHVIDEMLNPSDTSPPPSPSVSTVATSTPAPNPTLTASVSATATPTHSPSSKSHSSGSAVGIGVGVTAAGLLVLAALALYLYLSRKRKRELKAWDEYERAMSGVPGDKGTFSAETSPVQREDNLGLGSQSTGVHDDVQSMHVEHLYSKGPLAPPYSSTANGPPTPPIPARAPSHRIQKNEF